MQLNQIKGWGLGIFVRNTIEYYTIDLKPHCLEIYCEIVGKKSLSFSIQLNCKIISAVYILLKEKYQGDKLEPYLLITFNQFVF